MQKELFSSSEDTIFYFVWIIIYHYESTSQNMYHWLSEEILVNNFGKPDFSGSGQFVFRHYTLIKM